MGPGHSQLTGSSGTDPQNVFQDVSDLCDCTHLFVSLRGRPGLVRASLVSQGQCSCDSWGLSTLGCPRLPAAHPSPLFCVDCQRLLIQEVPSKVGAAIFPKRKLLNKIFCALERSHLLSAFVD